MLRSVPKGGLYTLCLLIPISVFPVRNVAPICLRCITKCNLKYSGLLSILGSGEKENDVVE